MGDFNEKALTSKLLAFFYGIEGWKPRIQGLFVFVFNWTFLSDIGNAKINLEIWSKGENFALIHKVMGLGACGFAVGRKQDWNGL